MRRFTMARVLYCNDLVPGCTFEARGDSDEEILAEFADHVSTAHGMANISDRSEEHTSELQSHSDLVCRLLLEKKKKKKTWNLNHIHYKRSIISIACYLLTR